MTLIEQIQQYWNNGHGENGLLAPILNDGLVDDITLDAYLRELETAIFVLKSLRAVPLEAREAACEAFWAGQARK